jgi:oxaloacetate decarboxylase alpha subunit
VREIGLIDVTLRDGNQSMWGATGITNSMVEDVAPLIARGNYHAIEFTTSTTMAMSVRFHREDPWERIRRTAAVVPDTPLGLLTSGLRFITWDRTPPEVMRLAFRTLMKNGIRRFWALDPLNDMDAVARIAAMIKSEGDAEVVAGVVYTVSPVHTDAHYAEKADALGAMDDVDGVYIKDVGGLLTPERVQTLVPLVKSRIGDRLLELHAHCNTGLAPLCCVEGARMGVDAIHTACAPLGNGSSLPAAENTVRNLRRAGFSVGVDDDALAEYAAYFTRVAELRGLPIGAPAEYDLAYYHHQVPGGMMGTLRRQLAEMGMTNRLPEVLDEVETVRRELGYPIMVTPFSQFVGAQSMLNVVTGERYGQVPNELVQYTRGVYGTPPAAIDPDVLDRISSSPAAGALDADREDPTVAELRKRFGGSLSDEDLLLRITMPAEQVDAMVERRGAGAAVPAGSAARPIMDLIEGLERRRDVTFVKVERPGFELTLDRYHRPSTGPER